MVAWPGELMLSLEENDSPRRAVSFSPKQFGGPGEPGSRKFPEMTLLPLPFGIFFASLTKTLNNHTPYAEIGVEQHLLVSDNQNINK